jgi:serine/threonine protein kinase
MTSRIKSCVPPGSPEELLSALRSTRLLSHARLHRLASQISKRKAPLHVWAADLVEKGWVTKFQARQMLAGRGSFLVLGPYLVLEPLGKGGMGHVFKARHRWMKREVALKIISSQPFADSSPSLDSSSEGFNLFPQALYLNGKQTGLHIDSLRREAQAAARVSHPHFVTAYAAGRVGSIYFLVMEYIEGADLERVVRWTGPLPISLACSFIRQAALALQHLHEQGLVHRDIKPTNLVLAGVDLKPDQPLTVADGQGILKILDFGLARKREEGAITESLSGTPDYVAPEVAHDGRAADIRSDLYSLGCTFYFLLTGQVPYPGGSWTEKLLRHHLDPLTSPEILRPEIPLPVVAILQKLLAKNPAKRYGIPAEVADALGAIEKTCQEADLAVVPPVRETALNEGSVNSPIVAKKLGGKNTQLITMPARKRHRSYRFIIQVGLAILFGMGIGLMARHWNTVRTWGAMLHEAIAEQSERVANTIQQEKSTPIIDEPPHPFILERNGKTHTSLKEAIAEAADGETIVIDGGGLQIVGGVDLRGKALTLKARANSRPVLHFIPLKEPRTRQSLLTHDRPLLIEGLDLVLPNVTKLALPSQPLHLLYSEGTSLRLSNCRLSAPEGHSPIAARNCPDVRLENCDILAGASALCLEVGEASSVEVELTGCRVVTNEADGAALALWAKETIKPSRVNLNLDGNHFEAGRIVSFSQIHAPVEVHASKNEITFRQAVVSYTNHGNEKAWEKTHWSEGANTYQGTSDWICVNGMPAGICGLDAWQRCWGQVGQGSSE